MVNRPTRKFRNPPNSAWNGCRRHATDEQPEQIKSLRTSSRPMKMQTGKQDAPLTKTLHHSPSHNDLKALNNTPMAHPKALNHTIRREGRLLHRNPKLTPIGIPKPKTFTNHRLISSPWELTRNLPVWRFNFYQPEPWCCIWFIWPWLRSLPGTK